VDVTLHSKGGDNESLVDAYGAGSVKQVPEPVSPRYRSRVLGVSSRYRSHGGKHEPEFHTSNDDLRRHSKCSTPADRGESDLISTPGDLHLASGRYRTRTDDLLVVSQLL
jgi:hypothetical protein